MSPVRAKSELAALNALHDSGDPSITKSEHIARCSERLSAGLVWCLRGVTAMANPVHIFSIYAPETRVTRFLYVPVTEKNENPTNEQIFTAVKKVQRHVNRTEPDTIVSYLGIGQEAISQNNPDEDQHWEPRQE